MASRPPLLDLLDILPSDGVETSPFVPQDVVFTSAGSPFASRGSCRSWRPAETRRLVPSAT